MPEKGSQVIVIQFKKVLKPAQMEKAKQDIMDMVEKGCLVMDGSYSYEVAYLKGE